jgi:site-specific DNA recombinase
VEKQVDQLLERIVESSIPSVIGAYEERVRKLEEEKLLIKERIINAGRPALHHDEILRTALDFVASPWKLWRSERLEQRRTVLKLTFADRLRYARNEGFRTAPLSLPFNVLSSVFGRREGMVGLAGLEPATIPL